MTINPQRQRELEQGISKFLNPNNAIKRREDEVDRMLRDDEEMASYLNSQRKLKICDNYSTKARRTMDHGGIF